MPYKPEKADESEKNLKAQALQEMARNWVRTTNSERIEKRAYSWVNSFPEHRKKRSSSKAEVEEAQ